MKEINFKLPNGYKATILKSAIPVISEIWSKKTYEKDFEITKDICILDIGANQGLFSLYAASKGAIVYSFEPEPNNFKILLKNIKQNKLENRIKAYNFALSNYKGFIDIYFEDYNDLFAPLRVTTSKAFLSNIYINQKGIKRQKVECITLKDAFDIINLKEIDLVKIDCEGAEFDILKSAGLNEYKKIKNIVLETHNSYSQKKLFYFIMSQDFNIINYEKISCPVNTGYLFVSRNKYIKKEPLLPLAIMSHEPYLLINKKYAFNGSESFSCSKKEKKLRYSWYVNNVKLLNENKSVLNYTFNKSGENKIKFEINDGRVKDKVEKKLLVLNDTYFENKNAFILSDTIKDYKIPVKDKMYFSISHTSFKHLLWIPDYFYLKILFPDYKRGKLIFEFNGNKIELSKFFNVIKLSGIPLELDINFSVFSDFSISPDKSENIFISWWFDNKKDKIVINDKKNNDNEVIQLKPVCEYYFSVTGEERKFLIPKEYLPRSWELKDVNIGIYRIIKGNPEKLSGYIMCNGKKEKLINGTKEIKIKFNNLDNDIDLTVHIEQINKTLKKVTLKKVILMKVMWWY